MYLVLPAGRAVHVTRVTLNDGTTRYLVDQRGNPESIVFWPGGRWGDDVLLYGRFDTVWDGPVAQGLLRRSSRALRKHFEKIRAFWVGPEAARLLDAGVRLKLSASSAREFDLVRGLRIH
jgi:hypothetical protein